MRSLQSTTREALARLGFYALFIKLATTLAFKSTSKAVIWRSKHIISPSLGAQSLAKKLVVIPIFLAKPLTHIPESFRRMPPPPVGQGLPIVDPSMLSLN